MYIACPFTKSVREQKVDILDNGRFACTLFEVADVLLHILDNLDIGHVAHDLIDIVVELVFVKLIARRCYVGFTANDNSYGHAHLTLYIVDGKNICRLTCCDYKRIVLESDRHYVAASDVIEVQPGKGVLVDLLDGNVTKLEAAKLCFGPEDIIGIDAGLYEQLLDIACLGLFLLTNLLNLLNGDFFHLKKYVGDIAHMRHLRQLRRIQIAQTRRKRNLPSFFNSGCLVRITFFVVCKQFFHSDIFKVTGIPFDSSTTNLAPISVTV